MERPDSRQSLASAADGIDVLSKARHTWRSQGRLHEKIRECDAKGVRTELSIATRESKIVRGQTESGNDRGNKRYAEWP